MKTELEKILKTYKPKDVIDEKQGYLFRSEVLEVMQEAFELGKASLVKVPTDEEIKDIMYVLHNCHQIMGGWKCTDTLKEYWSDFDEEIYNKIMPIQTKLDRILSLPNTVIESKTEWISKQDTEISLLKKEIELLSEQLQCFPYFPKYMAAKNELEEKDKLLSEANLKIRELEAFYMADKIIAKSEIDKAKEVISELLKQSYDIHEHCIDMGYMDNEDLTEGQEMLQSAIKNGTEFISSITKDQDNG